jgi:diaminopimelate epimerase
MQHTRNVSADPARGALVDVRNYSARNKANYSQVEIDRAERTLAALKEFYQSNAYYITYRKRFVAIKISNPHKVRQVRKLRQLESSYFSRNYEKVVTPQGVIYRIPKL